MLLHQYLRQSIREFPNKEALTCGRKRITYEALGSAVTAFSSYLLSKGLQKGERVAICFDNSVEAVVALFGTWEAGGCCVTINSATPPQRLAHMLKNCQPKFLLCSRSKSNMLEHTLGISSEKIHVVWADIEESTGRGESFERICREQRPFPGPRLIGEDLAAIIYTSGSTGKPKGVTHLHRTIDAAVESIKKYLANSSDDVILSVLSLSSSYGLLQLLVTFRTGGRLVLETGLGYPYEIVKRIQEEGVTGMAGVPTLWAHLLRLEGTDPSSFGTLRYITNAAAALPSSFVPRLRRKFPNTKIFLMHGLTECLRTTFLPPDEIESKSTSVGLGMQNVELWIEDEARNRLGAGQVGEMIYEVRP